MEKIPSTLILHKFPDSADTQFASMQQTLAESPLEQFLGVTKYGEYQQAPVLNNFAFHRVEDLWDEPLDGSELDKEIVKEQDEIRIVVPVASTESPTRTTTSPDFTAWDDPKVHGQTLFYQISTGWPNCYGMVPGQN
jgi:hypothetical protein